MKELRAAGGKAEMMVDYRLEAPRRVLAVLRVNRPVYRLLKKLGELPLPLGGDSVKKCFPVCEVAVECRRGDPEPPRQALNPVRP